MLAWSAENTRSNGRRLNRRSGSVAGSIRSASLVFSRGRLITRDRIGPGDTLYPRSFPHQPRLSRSQVAEIATQCSCRAPPGAESLSIVAVEGREGCGDHVPSRGPQLPAGLTSSRSRVVSSAHGGARWVVGLALELRCRAARPRRRILPPVPSGRLTSLLPSGGSGQTLAIFFSEDCR